MTESKPKDPKSVSGQAITTMDRLGIAPLPPNYQVWYGYHSGQNAELVSFLDSVLAEGGSATEAESEAIHRRFFGAEADEEVLQEAGNQLQSMIEDIRAKLGAAGETTLAFGDKLTRFSGQLSRTAAPEALQGILAEIIAETSQVVARNQELEQSLESSSSEIDQLRETLQEARQEAVTDALTGIANRRFFDSRLKSEEERALYDHAPLSLLIIDIDHFKHFNDSFGHQIGDEVLKVVARTLKSCVKGKDTPARYGGEEFAVILPDTQLGDAGTVAEQIRQALATKRLQNKRTGESYGEVTLSIGAAQLRPGEPLSSLIKRADKALYLAKNSGRNRVTSEQELPEARRKAG